MKRETMKKGTMRKSIMAGAMALTMATAMVTTGLAPMENVLVHASTTTNNTFDTAKELVFNTSMVEELSQSDNVRYYKFTLDEASQLNIGVSSSSSSPNKYLTIYDENRTEVYSYNNYSRDFTTGNIYLTGGTYYLKLQSTCSNVTFNVTKDSLMESFKETQTANNDSIDDANTISLAKQYKGVLGENDTKDYFKFEVPATGKIHVNINKSDYAVASICDDSDRKYYSKYSSNGAVVDEDVTLPAGTYYFVMSFNDSGSGRGSYTFKLDYAVASPKINSVKNSGKRKMTVKWEKVEGAAGYELQYARDKSFKSGVTKKTLKPSAGSASYSKLAKGKTYYVRMRAYANVNGKTKYSGWGSSKSVVIKK